ncbi:MAG TPA: TlpA disulfide reductase family protein [Sphingomicrobium sp.]|nr:TlpA disulfide reductase family protein [Sphingomicrobium sp.]
MRFFLFASAAVLTLAACHNTAQRAPANNEAASAAGEGIKGVHRDQKGKPGPNGAFEDMDGQTVKLANFKGRPVLVNLWATWCAPCVKELPTLDKLARANSIPVVAVSEDTAPHASVEAFLKSHQISTLKAYQDPKMALSGSLGPDTVLPTSILLDANGHEVWRYVGDLDWTSPAAAKLLSEVADPAKAH